MQEAPAENQSSNDSDGSWWSRECGVRELLASGLPLAVSTATFAVMNFCDRLFLTRYDSDVIGPVMVGGAASWNASAGFIGMALYAIAFVSQYRGSGQPHRIGAVIWHACAMVFLALPVFALLAMSAEQVLLMFGHEHGLVEREATYFRIMLCGMPALIMSMGLNAFFIGLERTRIVMVLDIAAAVVNVALDYAWIFGVFGFPEWGMEGAAWATVTALWIKFVGYLVLVAIQPDVREFGFLSGWRPDWKLFLSLIRYGGPNGMQFVLEGGAFTIILLFLGEAGDLALEATTLAFSVNMVAFVPVLGIGMAVTSMVGNQIGRVRPDLAVRATWSGILVSTIYSVVFVVFYLATPTWFLVFHDLENDQHRELLNWTVILLRFVAVYCLFDAWQVIFASAIKGAGDTWFTVVALAVSSVSIILLGVLLRGSFESMSGKLLWWWTLLTLFIVTLASAFLWRFLQGAWKSMSVIRES